MVHMCEMIISPGVLFIFENFVFWVVSGVKREKMAQNDKKIRVVLYSLGATHYMIFIYGTYV